MNNVITMTREGKSGYRIGKLVADMLPKRQAEALLYTATGHSDKEAAEHMNCAPATVKHLRKEVHFKCGSHTGPELITRAFENGYLRLASITLAWLISLAGISATPTPALASDNHSTTEQDETLRPRNRQRRTNNRTTRARRNPNSRSRNTRVLAIHIPSLYWDDEAYTLFLEGTPLNAITENHHAQ